MNNDEALQIVLDRVSELLQNDFVKKRILNWHLCEMSIEDIKDKLTTLAIATLYCARR